ncbi:MAG: TrmH family RNA methyltransferase [Bacteroidaceae bacterium]|nr:TrmH family RNA methyltransferase [Bacteroidaceae bacterium]MBR5706648.1 TrmH family RNA methyltransferase [Bacteroidaceae bacterium]
MRKLNVTELGRIDVEEFKNSKKLPLTIILDDVRSLYNVGSVFRTSDAFRIERIILCGITATPDNSLVEIHKTALGAEESVEWIYSQDCVSVIKDLNTKGYVTVAVEQVENSIKLDNLVVEKDTRYALVLGNEVKGVNQNVVDLCKYSLEIPQYGTKHSLNVSVSAGLVIWEFYKQLKELL